MRLPFRVLPPQARAYDVVGLGLNSVDLVTVVAEYPVCNTKQRLQRFAKLPGGQTATALAICARLGWRTTYLGRFGADELGATSRESLEREGVDTTGAETVPGATNQFAVVLVDARSGERTVLWDRDPALTIAPSDVRRDRVVAARMAIVDCHETAAATQVARYAREEGVVSIVDVEKVRPGIGDLLQQIDAIIAAEAFPTELTGYDSVGRAIEAMAREFSAPIVCVTLGAEGSLARCNGREIRTPAFSLPCIDSTGAGDAFRGGFAAGCLRAGDDDLDLEGVLTYANAVAALNCRALGARGGMPTVAEVEHLVAGRLSR